MNNSNLNLLVLFSSSVSLKLWKNTGLYDREIGYYNKLKEKFMSITFLTYDYQINDLLKTNDELNEFQFLYNKNQLKQKIFGILSPFFYRSEIKKIDIVKSNQISGSWVGIIIKLFYKKKLIIRSGYIPTKNLLYSNNSLNKFLKILLWSFLEFFSFIFADLIFVASNTDKEYITKKYSLYKKPIYVINTPIDTQKFIIKKNIPSNRKILYIGRLSKEKNVNHIIEACSGISNCELVIVGDGNEKENLVKLSNSVNIKFLGLISNYKLPEIINNSRVLVLPSSFEGTPKVLLEAMSCGIPVIASKIPGIEEIIVHNETGLLFTLGDIVGLRKCINRILSDQNLYDKLSLGGRKLIETKYSIDKTVDKEYNILKSIN